MTYTMLVKYLSTRCQILVNSCQPLSNSCQLLSTAVKFLSTPCQILVNSCQPLSNSCQIFMPIKSICQISVNWISWFIRPYNIILYPQNNYVVTVMCRSKSTVPHTGTSNYAMPSYKDVIMSNFDSFCKSLYVNNIKRFSNIFQILFKHFSNVFRINFECFSSSL